MLKRKESRRALLAFINLPAVIFVAFGCGKSICKQAAEYYTNCASGASVGASCDTAVSACSETDSKALQTFFECMSSTAKCSGGATGDTAAATTCSSGVSSVASACTAAISGVAPNATASSAPCPNPTATANAAIRGRCSLTGLCVDYTGTTYATTGNMTSDCTTRGGTFGTGSCISSTLYDCKVNKSAANEYIVRYYTPDFTLNSAGSACTALSGQCGTQ